jgi:hypothetical protein
MEPLQLLVLAGHERAELALSALPQAPTVPFVERAQRARRTRGALARTFHRLGDAVAPAPAPVVVCAD